MPFEEKYNVICNIITIINQMHNIYAHCLSLKKLIAEEKNPVNLQCDSKQLYEAAKKYTELRIEYLELIKALDKAAGPNDVWALKALDELSRNII